MKAPQVLELSLVDVISVPGFSFRLLVAAFRFQGHIIIKGHKTSLAKMDVLCWHVCVCGQHLNIILVCQLWVGHVCFSFD